MASGFAFAINCIVSQGSKAYFRKLPDASWVVVNFHKEDRIIFAGTETVESGTMSDGYFVSDQAGSLPYEESSTDIG